MSDKDKNFRKLFEPSFLICVVVLGVACAGKKAILDWSGAQLVKIETPIKKSLDLIDADSLWGYTVIEKKKIQKDILKELGTDEYLQVLLEDTEVDASSGARFCSLFITYYGKPGVVPHVPEECYVGGGNQQLSREVLRLTLSPDDDGIVEDTIGLELDVRHLVFGPKSANIWASASKFDRLYVFKVNDGYGNGRTRVRELLGRNIFGKYSFFSKVEWGFYGKYRGRVVRADASELKKASEKLLSAILPILEKEYWPDWKELNRKQ